MPNGKKNSEISQGKKTTEWKEFRSPDFQKMSKMMNSKILIDGRNQFSSETITNQGFEYYQIGVN